MWTSLLPSPTLAPQVSTQVLTRGPTPTLHRTLGKCWSCGGCGQMPPCFMGSQPRGCSPSSKQSAPPSLAWVNQSGCTFTSHRSTSYHLGPLLLLTLSITLSLILLLPHHY